MATDQTLAAMNAVNGGEKPEEMGIGEWIWGALSGDFEENRSAGQIGFDMVVSLIPLVDTVCDIRDLCANIRAYRKEPNNKLILFFIALTIIGFIPEIGSIVKGVVKILFVYIRKYLKDVSEITQTDKLIKATSKAVDAAMPKIVEFLQNSQIIKWATNNRVPDLFKFCAKSLEELAAKISADKLRTAYDKGADALLGMLNKIHDKVPVRIAGQIEDIVAFMQKSRAKIRAGIGEFVDPIRTILKVTAKKLDDHAWIANSRMVNKGWIAPMTETGAAKLVNKSPPKWAKKKITRVKPMDVTVGMRKVKSHPLHPQLSEDNIKTFGRDMRADSIKGPATLYRVLDPTNEGGGMFWVDEKTFKSLKNRDDWREKLAVKPNWNQNGQFVKYEIPAGEELKVWRGKAASQPIDGTPYYLEGGAEQVVFSPGARDTMASGQARVDVKTGEALLDGYGNVDHKIEFKDVTGEVAPAKLREKINVPRITGPYSTNWGFVDYDPQVAERLLLAVPSIH